MLVSGAAGQGQSVHLAPAALHLMEHLPVHTLSSATLFAASAKMPEEACANVSCTVICSLLCLGIAFVVCVCRLALFLQTWYVSVKL